MSFSDMFKVSEFKSQIAQLTTEKEELETTNSSLTEQNRLLSKEKSDLELKSSKLKEEAALKLSLTQIKPIELDEKIKEKESRLTQLKQDIDESDAKFSKLATQINSTEQRLYELDAQVGDLEARNDMASYGLPEPLYDFATSTEYKEKLDDIREEQKDAIRWESAYECDTNWTVNGSEAKGRQMIKRDIKSLFRSFNNECTNAINKVTYSNYDRIELRIRKSFEQHNKMHREYGLHILDSYLELKLAELNVAFHYAQKKQHEKELLREQRAKEREEKALEKELKQQHKKIDKEIDHYNQAISELNAKLLSSEENKDGLESEIEKLRAKLQDLHDQNEQINHREFNGAGYVYIISNIGSFGKDVVKIGVTRRLEPLDRINELSSASVPFKFDVHALIFSEDAYALETELHNRFDKNRINKVNNRKEYFRIPIDEIETELKKYQDVTVDFHENPEAPEYRQTLAIEQHQNSVTN